MTYVQPQFGEGKICNSNVYTLFTKGNSFTLENTASLQKVIFLEVSLFSLSINNYS